jgi:hypothetical protein
MGYNTEFQGHFDISPALSRDQVAYLRAFAYTRRMVRSETLTSMLDDPLRTAVGLPHGLQGCFFVGGQGEFGQDHDASILDYNKPPSTQPGLWCQWVPNDDGTELAWDGGEKFYDYVPWMQYLIDYFFKTWDRTLNGQVRWRGESFDDVGILRVVNNTVYVMEGGV